MWHKLFVYGTLRRGLHNHTRLAKAHHYGDAYIDGAMFSLGGFPFINTTLKGIIRGEVYEVDDETLKECDRLEGYVEGSSRNFYERIKVPCTLGIDVLVYVQNDRTGVQPVLSGDWKGYIERKKAHHDEEDHCC